MIWHSLFYKLIRPSWVVRKEPPVRGTCGWCSSPTVQPLCDVCRRRAEGATKNLVDGATAFVLILSVLVAAFVYARVGSLLVSGLVTTGGAFLVALLRATRVWRWGMAEALGLPCAYLACELMGANPASPEFEIWEIAFSFAGPFVAAYVAQAGRMLLGPRP